jgi:ABC-type sugar transport system ATPase subunit
MDTTTDTVLAARGLTKSFPGVRALDRVDLELRPGRVHALLGENGAGKSTLVGLLTGNSTPDEGTLLLDGESLHLSSPRDAVARGISAVYQELSLLPAMTVLDNVVLGQERRSHGLLDRRSGRDRARTALARVGLEGLDLRTRVEDLSLANQQLVEIARALLRKSRVVILDEPSAVLSGEKLTALHAVVRSLTAEGVAVLYITHLLDEVGDLADDVTVLRDGRNVSTGAVEQYDIGRIIRDMVGRDVNAVFPPRRPARDEVVLEVRGLVPASTSAPPPPVDLTARAGEIVALAGLVGCGRSRLLRTLGGSHPRMAGSVSCGGREVGPSVRAAIGAGVVLVPEERKTDGLVLPLSVGANTSLTALGDIARGGWLSADREDAVFVEQQRQLGIKASSYRQDTWQLSGGNQQKIVLGKWLRTGPKVLLLDEPTRGVDVGAKAEIYRIITDLAAEGLTVVMASSDLPEVLGLAHRVLVFRGGAPVGELTGDDIHEETIMSLALASGQVPA